LLAAFNPCGFALLPAYLGYFVGVAGDDNGTARPSPLRAVSRAIVVSAVLTMGFALVFGAVGLAVTLASLQVSRYSPWLTVVIGIGLVALGGAVVAGFEPKLALPQFRKGTQTGTGLLGIFLFGISYATVSLSCTLPPFLAAVAGTFGETSVVGGLATFGLYAAGMGTVLAVLTVALAVAQRSVVSGMRRVLPYVHRVSGVLLLLAGAYVGWYGVYEILQNAGRDVPSGPVEIISAISGRITQALSDAGPTWVGVVGAGLLVATLAASVVASPKRRRPGRSQPPASNPGADPAARSDAKMEVSP